MLDKNKINFILVLLMTLTFFLFQFISKKNPVQSVKNHKVKPNEIEKRNYKDLQERKNVQNLIVNTDKFEAILNNVDGSIQLDKFGNIVNDKELRRLFDYFLIDIGNYSLNNIENKLRYFARSQLNEGQINELLRRFEIYTNYLKSLDHFSKSIGPEITLAKRIELLSEFRKTAIGQEMANGFFADEEDYARYSLNDKNLDNLTISKEKISHWLAQEDDATRFHDELILQTISEQASINSDEIFNQREEAFGQKAAERLTALDQNRRAWNQTVQNYIDQRTAIINGVSSMTLENLKNQYDKSTLKRLEVYWHHSQ